MKERSEQKPARKGDSELSPKEYSQKLAKRDRMTLFILGGDSLDIDRPLTAEEETELLSGRTFYDAIPDLIKEYKTR